MLNSFQHLLKEVSKVRISHQQKNNMNELSLIKKISSLIPDSSYIGDDTAYLEELGIVVTTDTLAEDIHFRLKTTSPFDLGYKSLAVNLSDIASDGAIPSYAFVSISLPKYIDENFVEEFYKGINTLASKYGVIIAGGDITGAEKLFINITAIGKTEGYKPARRNNAKAGDVVFVTGNLGSSRAGFEILENEKLFKEKISKEIFEKFKKAHTTPEPHVITGREILINSEKTPCMMDTSDGLADALFKIARASKVEIDIDKNLIPYDKDLKKIADIKNANLFDWILFGGEDYTLAGCIDKKTYENLYKKGLPVIKTGTVSGENKNGLVKIGEKIITEKTVIDKSFNHFSI